MMNTHERPNPSALPDHPQSQLRHQDPLFDFDIEPLVDADDPGFNSEFDTDISDFSDCEDSTDPSDASSDDGNGSGQGRAKFFETSDAWLRILANHFQNDLVKEPVSTQIILGREVSKVFESYQQHGSAARLSASVMEFLEAGDTVTRPLKRVVEEDEVDVMGHKTGRKKKVVKRSIERAKLRFVPLPKVGVNPKEAQRRKERMTTESVAGGKRKASVGIIGSERKRFASSGDGRHIRAVNPEVDTASTRTDIPVRSKATEKRTAIRSDDAMDVDQPSNAGPPQQPHQNFSKTLDHPRPQIPQRSGTEPWPAPFLLQYPILTCPPELYSLTNDAETQSLLLGRDPIVPFQPLASLKIIIPKYPDITFPPEARATLTRILHLHAAKATKSYKYLMDKYTLKPTLSIPNPPQPPAALFRLAITSSLHSDLAHLFTPTLEHPLVIDPESRGLLRDLYDKQPGRLNPVEKSVVARLTGLDIESVDAWWEERMRGLFPAEALRRWRRAREAEGIVRARVLGCY